MSLGGRHIIDRIKLSLSKLNMIKIPCPPHGNPAYWESLYEKMDLDFTFEWGNFSYNDVAQFTFDPHKYFHHVQRLGYDIRTRKGTTEDEADDRSITFLDAIRATTTTNDDNNPIMVLGCGQSRFGEELLLSHQTKSGGATHSDIRRDDSGPIVIQMDISHSALKHLSHQCSHHISSGAMRFQQDDANTLSTFENDSISAVVDKGLMDGLLCSDEFTQMGDIMRSVNRVLDPGGVFLFFSLSRPDFLLPHLVEDAPSSSSAGAVGKRKALWQDIGIWELENMLIYRFEKDRMAKDNEERRRRLAERQHWKKLQ